MLSRLTFFNKNKNIFVKYNKNNYEFVPQLLKSAFWFSFGAIIGFILFVSFLLIIYQKTHKDAVYSGVFVGGIDYSGKPKRDIKNHFAKKNRVIEKYTIELKGPTTHATFSAKQVGFSYDDDLMAEQAYILGRSENQISNLSVLLQAYFSRIQLPVAYRQLNDKKLDTILSPLRKKIDIEPVNALFTFENGKVSSFTLAQDGQAVDVHGLKKQIYQELVSDVETGRARGSVVLPIKVVKPDITNENVNNLGIRELVGEGTSLFAHSIENRIFNLQLAASRLNGILIAPGEVFSFNKTLGDVSKFTGYKQAYVIENGRTVLGDGGGVCQVSTTLFRAALAAGLPIVERSPHAYRVNYYEQDSRPGIDAAVYSPSVDLKFKNDTGAHILIQTQVDLDNMRLTFDLYGAKDGREVEIGKPVILSQSAAPEPRYQDDPELPKGETKQVDFAAAGANVYFTRTVKKDGKEVLSDKFTSHYRPWQAVFLKGTRE